MFIKIQKDHAEVETLLAISSIETIDEVDDLRSGIRTKSGNYFVVNHLVIDIADAISEAVKLGNVIAEIKHGF